MNGESVNMVKHWLQEIGCNVYIEQFLDNGYDDLDICKQIGLKDIEAIGVRNVQDRVRLLTAVEDLKGNVSSSKKPFYFVLENPKSPSFSASKRKIQGNNGSAGKICENITCNTWACCTTLGSVSSGTSEYASNCSHNSISLETEPLVQSSQHQVGAHVLMTKMDTWSSMALASSTNDITNVTQKMKGSSPCSEDVDMDSDQRDEHPVSSPDSSDHTSQPIPSLRPSSSYTTADISHTVQNVPWRRSVSESCSMMSACGHHNRSVPPPLPRCPPPSASCMDMSLQSDADSITTHPMLENSSSASCSERGNSFPRTTVGGLQQDYHQGYWSSHSHPARHRKHKGLARIFSFNRLTTKKYTYKPARGDLCAREMTMSDEDRIQLMVMVKEGKLGLQQALNTVKQYEEDKKKGVHRSLNDYLHGDGIKMPVCVDKSSKSGPLRFLRSFSFRNSKRKKFLQDLEYYYKEQEKRQRGLIEKMAKMELCEENTYSRPQCCSSKSCDGTAQSLCRNQMSSPVTSPLSPCDTHQPNCYTTAATCSTLNPGGVSRRGSGRGGFSPYLDHHGSVTNYEMKGSTSETSFRGSSPQYSVYNSPARSNRRLYEDQTGWVGGAATAGYPSPRFCRSESEPAYFDRTYGGRHSYHGIPPPPRRHSEVVTFVHHVQQPTATSPYSNRTVCSKCQRQSVCDNPLVLPPCGGGYMNYGPSPCCRHRGVVTNVIAEECSPCLSNSSSIEDVSLSPRSLSVKANVHRVDHQQMEDSVNNNSCHSTRQGSEPPERSSQLERKPTADHQSPAQPWSSGSSCGQSSQHSVSTESEPPIEQYKPKSHVSPQNTDSVTNTESWDENENTESNDTRNTDLQENYAQTSDLVINTAIVQSVQQLCGKLGLQHLLPVFLNNGFETLELFKQLEEQDLCMLGITDATERAKVLTAVTLLPDEQEFVPTYKYKFSEDKDQYSKINQREVNTIQNPQPCVQLDRVEPSTPLSTRSLYGRKVRDKQAPPLYQGPALQTRDSGCYMEHLNNSNQSH